MRLLAVLLAALAVLTQPAAAFRPVGAIVGRSRLVSNVCRAEPNMVVY